MVIQFSRAQNALHTQVCDTLVGTHPYTCLRSVGDGESGWGEARHLVSTSALELVLLPEAEAGRVSSEMERTVQSLSPLYTLRQGRYR